jgi:lysozyme
VKVNKEFIDCIKHHEGVRYKPYRCSAALWTIGVGHVLYPDQAKLPSTPEGMAARKAYQLKPQDDRTWSKEEVDAILAKDVIRFERGVERLLPIKLSQNEFNSLVSWSFNAGLGALQRSTVRQALLRGDKITAMSVFLDYCKAGGQVVRGLEIRRKDECTLFFMGSEMPEIIRKKIAAPSRAPAKKKTVLVKIK